MQSSTYCYLSPIGPLLISGDGESITGVSLVTRELVCEGSPNKVVSRCVSQLEEYFAGKRKNFDVPLSPKGTPFQKKVWQALRDIPYGNTSSYGQIALSVGSPKASRAVGGANNKNPILILIPCHRCIGKDSSLVGFGCGLDAKRFLLELEKANS